ncbi:hypothetical protein D5086_017429 [Populus alba]|uniref:Uncharacterized protein n=1 Tax=Populus alba TaxID=43335 RepID=A0ACC4BX87_POPAL
MLAVFAGLGRYQDIIADGNLEDLTGARSSRATTATMPPSTGMTLGGFVGASLMTTTLTSPPPGISLSIIDDDHPKVSILPVAKGPNLPTVVSSPAKASHSGTSHSPAPVEKWRDLFASNRNTIIGGICASDRNLPIINNEKEPVGAVPCRKDPYVVPVGATTIRGQRRSTS